MVQLRDPESQSVTTRPRRRDGRFDDHTDDHACRFATVIQYSLSAPWVRSPRHPGGECGAEEPKRTDAPRAECPMSGISSGPPQMTLRFLVLMAARITEARQFAKCAIQNRY